MSNFTEFDFRLREFLKDPDHILAGIALLDAFQAMPILAAAQPYAIEVNNQKVTPVFTTVADLEHFQEEQASAKEQEWVERKVLEVMTEELDKGLDGLAFNLKKEGDDSNSVIFPNEDLVSLINYLNNMISQLMSKENVEADVMDKTYLVPVFIFPKGEANFERVFPAMATPEGKSYVPAFSNLDSFAKWYNNDEFGGRFREHRGMVVTWTLADIYRPRNGENDLNETFGVAINPFDEQQILVDWSDIDSE